jgi:hypothetical protein
MMRLGDVLLPGQVNLALEGTDKNDCVLRVIELLRGDSRVKDFDALVAAVMERSAPAIEENGCGICIAHGRTQGVSALVMAAGRLPEGIVSPETKNPISAPSVPSLGSAATRRGWRGCSRYLRLRNSSRYFPLERRNFSPFGPPSLTGSPSHHSLQANAVA